MTEPTKNSVDTNKSLAGCGVPISPLTQSVNQDLPPDHCSDADEICGNKFDDTQKRTAGATKSWLQDIPPNQYTGHGQSALCDPVQFGHIANQTGSSTHIYRYNRAIRGCDEAITDLFRDVIVNDQNGRGWPIPIIWGSQERAVQIILQDNVRDDNTLVVDRIKLPIMAVHNTDIQYSPERYVYHKALDYSRRSPDGKPGFTASEVQDRDTVFGISRGVPVNISYTLYAWTLYEEDMNMIVEQIFTKLVPAAYISVRGVQWEIIVILDGSANNIDTEPGDMNERVVKYQWNITAQTYIPQPLVRKKAVLKIKTDYEATNSDDVIEQIERMQFGTEVLND